MASAHDGEYAAFARGRSSVYLLAIGFSVCTIRKVEVAMDKGISELRSSPMMAHLLDAIEERKDIGHYGRLVFVIVSRYFLDESTVVRLISTQPDMGETRARALVLQAASRNYNPPSRERIVEWQRLQEFPICPNPDDPNGCNVYRELTFPDEVYDNIQDLWEKKAESTDE